MRLLGHSVRPYLDALHVWLHSGVLPAAGDELFVQCGGPQQAPIQRTEILT